MAPSIQLHDSIVRTCVATRGGYVFSTAGDGFGVAFDTPQGGIEAALRIQQELLEADWPGPTLSVRMGLHSGTAEEREGDYFGTAVNRAARIHEAANGSQILVSAATAEAKDWLDGDTTLADLGTHHLADVEEPFHLFEVRHPELPVVSTPIRTTDGHRTNLPEYLTTFVGRDSLLADLKTYMTDHRLVVLTGVGGTGKTRLAVEAARHAVARFADGVWMVELAAVTNPAVTMTAIGDIWGLRPGEGAPMEDVVARYLRDRELLLIVDNCEHLLEAAASAIRHILDVAPGVRVMATSRESLGIPGETLLQVPSLSVPPGAHDLDSEATDLFLDRAATASPDFTPGPADLTAVARICLRVDGMPLGIELAAARLRTLSPEELADRLEASFRILAGSAKASLPRQRTLAATIDWSHDLLDSSERALFRRQAVFSGGFDLSAAEALGRAEGEADWEVLDVLESLIDKSLVLSSQAEGGSTRYRMLEPMRQYAQEKLSESGEAEEMQRLHAEYFSDLVAAASRLLRRSDQATWMGRLDTEYSNIRAAFTTLLETHDRGRYLQMAFDLFCHWMSGGMQLEAINTALAGLEQDTEVDPTLEVKVWWTTAFLGAQITRPESVGYAQRGRDLAGELDDPNLVGRMELALGAAIRHSTSDPAFVDHLREGRRLLDDNPGPSWWEPEWDRALTDFLLFEYLPHDDERRTEHFQASIAAFESLGDEAFLGAALQMGVLMGVEVGRDHKKQNIQRAIEITDRLDMPLWRGHALMAHGVDLLLEEGDRAEATEQLAAAATDLEECGDLSCWASTTRLRAVGLAVLGDTESAFEGLAKVIDSLPDLPLREIHKPRAVDSAAEILLAAGDHTRAALVIGLAAATPVPVASRLDRPHERLRKEIEAELGEGRVAELAEVGAGWDLDEGLATIRGWLTAPDQNGPTP